MNKVIIIGCGNVGMSYAFSLLNQKVTDVKMYRRPQNMRI